MSLYKVLPIVLTVAIGAIVAGVAFLGGRRNASNQYTNYPTGDRGGSGRNERMCGICLKQMEPCEVKKLSCGHIFCKSCMELLVSGTQTSCPDCRREFC